MRLLGTIENATQGKRFSQYLTSEGIRNQVDIVTNTDWGSDQYGDRQANLWVIQEEQVQQAQKLFKEFLENPNDSRFQEKQTVLKNLIEPGTSKEVARDKLVKIQQAASAWQSQSIGLITLYLLLTCTLLFMWGVMSVPRPADTPSQVPPMGLMLVSPVTRTLMYDYPKAYEIYDRLYRLYQKDQSAIEDNEESPTEEQSLPPETEALLQKFRKTPVWTGVYDKIVLLLQDKSDEINWNQPLFEKIKDGQAWRVFTPALLHSDIIHLFFNMIWLLVLGKQIESRVGAFRYVLFVIIAAILSNTAQYLMSGANFLGFSGVVAAMLGFIYIRQKSTPWEGYQLHSSTLLFITFFMLAMLGIQVLSFVTEVVWNWPLAPRIANTAHIVGFITGYFLGKWSFFGWQARPV